MGQSSRRGVTLPELLLSIALMSMVALAMAALATAVRSTRGYAEGQGTAAQHARVALARIRSTIEDAYATADFPGMTVISTQVGSYWYPDTLVVWSPTGNPVNAAGPPLYSELVIFCPDPAAPYRLVEIKAPTDMRSTPALSDASAWLSNINSIKTSSAATKTILTDMLRIADAGSVTSSGGNSSSQLRGAVRFGVMVRPKQSDWTNYKSGTVAWTDLPWVQDIYGSQTGLRQSWCRTELQLVSATTTTATANSAAIPFFGSATLYYQLTK
ncbi:MAG: prepilin-type N-terminal cleavage/methylation domain-containing protein [Planctomycetes bacterium]|nr:prepilin-type N-terminal cleavage/methylation domain-containing protein [Planctomycetota bacterium]